MGRMTAGSLDVKRIRAEIEAAFACVNRFTEIKRKVTAGKAHLDAIAEYIDEVRRDLGTALQRIRATVADASSEAA